MWRYLALYVAFFAGSCFAALGFPLCSDPGLAALQEADMEVLLGGACPNVGCVPKTCATTGCGVNQVLIFCTAVTGTTKCIRQTTGALSQCGTLTGYQNCSITTLTAGCVTVATGNQDEDGDCLESYCTNSSSCGTTLQTCNASACPPG
jgi:hypothetical protein